MGNAADRALDTNTHAQRPSVSIPRLMRSCATNCEIPSLTANRELLSMSGVLGFPDLLFAVYS